MYGAITHPVIWRGSRREVDIVFGNVRDASWLTEDHFRARPGTWRIVIDYPFDQPGHSGAEDLARLDRMIESGLESHTIAWLPRFLSDERMTDVRRLVILDWLLGGAGERWTGYADHLSEVDRVQARAILESQRTALREGLRRAIQECYGAAAPTPGTLAPGGSDDRILVSLDPSFSPAAPVGADLGAAFGNLVDQAFSATYPGHPRFEPGDVEVTVRDLAAVYSHVLRAVADPDGRVRLEGDITGVRRVANALGVGSAGETHFLFGDDRFSPGGPSSSGQPPGTACSRRTRSGPAGYATGSTRWCPGWACGTRSPTWSCSPGRRCGSVPGTSTAARSRRRSPGRSGRRWNCGPSRCPRRLTGSWPCPARSRSSASTSTRT